MIDMPPLRFAEFDGLRMGYYDAGPESDATPLVLLHGWPELAFSWRHQIKAFSEAGFRVIAPDQRGFGATDAPTPVEAYDLEHLTGDLVRLLDHLKIGRAIFVGHDWGGFVAWQMPLRHVDRVAGVVGVNTPHLPRAPVDPIAILRKRFGESMYIVRFQAPGREVDRIFSEHVESVFAFFMRGPQTRAADAAPPNLDFPSLVAAYNEARDHRPALLSAEEMRVYVETFRRTGFTGGINWYRNITRNWERAAALDHMVRVPSLMITAELDYVLPPSASAGMEAIVPDLERHLVKGSGHWTPQEAPDEVSRVILDWRRRRFG